MAQSKERLYMFKVGCLFVLTIQTTLTVLLLRYSRTKNPGKQYLASTAVFLTEVLKLLYSLFILYAQEGLSIRRTIKIIKEEIIEKPNETIKPAIPSGLYTLQNNLLYLALTHLDAATYQVTYQLKTLNTAIFSKILLNTKLRLTQWCSLVLLMIGVSLVQFQSSGPSKESDANYFVGLTSVLGASVCSGFAGVYFEKLVKTGSEQTSNLLVRNIQLGLFSIVISLFGVIYNDFDRVMENGFFQGYDEVTAIVIFFQSIGGIVVAFTIKYASNILKCFATSISIILSTVCSYVLLGDLAPTGLFVVGTSIVISSSFLYGYRPEVFKEVKKHEESSGL